MMTNENWQQVRVLAMLVAIYSVLAAATYLIFPLDKLVPSQAMPIPEITIPRWQLALANAAIGIFIYGLLGLVGFWLARRLGIPGVFKTDSGWQRWLLLPMLLGWGFGIAISIADLLFAMLHAWSGFPQPTFPFSLVASVTAAIGEEILFRSFLLGLWIYLMNFALHRWINRSVILGIGNLLAALAFAAGHLPGGMLIFGVTNPADMPVLILLEILLLNSVVGLVAGIQYFRQGLVAAISFHFWVNVVLHILRPLIG